MGKVEHHEHKFHSFRKRAAYSIGLVGIILIAGTLTFHYVEHYSYVDAFYFISMIATAQGPAYAPTTNLGKILASFFAFVSIGAVVAAFAFLFGPFLGKLAKIGEEKLEEEEKELEGKKIR